jgi:hypothetical protein
MNRHRHDLVDIITKKVANEKTDHDHDYRYDIDRKRSHYYLTCQVTDT